MGLFMLHLFIAIHKTLCGQAMLDANVEVNNEGHDDIDDNSAMDRSDALHRGSNSGGGGDLGHGIILGGTT